MPAAGLPDAIAGPAGALARRLGASPGEALLAAVAAVLHRHTLRERVTVAGRALEVPAGASFAALLERVRAGPGPAPAGETLAALPEPRERGLSLCARLLDAALAEPGRPLGLLPLPLEEAERRALAAGNDTGRRRPPATLHALVAAGARRDPGAAALVFEGGRLTHAELEREAGLVAHRLRRLGVGPGSVAGVCMERSPELVIALLGVLKAGGAYLPLDPGHPPARSAMALRDAGAAVVIAQRRLDGRLTELGGERLFLGPDGDDLRGEPAGAPPDQARPGDLAYVIHTSGSTGRPKGVMVAHEAICNRLLWMIETFGIGARDRFLQKTPVTFDVSIPELFGPLIAGGRLVIARPGGHRDPRYLARLIAEQGVTTCHFVPSMLADFLREPDLDGCDRLRRVLCSGESLPAALRRRFFERLGAELHNLYGPTEAAVEATWWRCRPDDTGPVPIGRPIANCRVAVLDAALRPVPPGIAGQLALAGACLARGYAGRPDLTAAAFVPDPLPSRPGERAYLTGDMARLRPDGAVEFLGRADDQVKVRGVRIELGEVETALREHPAVAAAAVAAREEPAGGGLRLVAYVVPRPGQAEEPSHRDFLAGRLPASMVPAAFVTLPALPLTPSGKLDRRALPEPGRARDLPGPPAPPRTPVERELAAKVRELLGLDAVGVTDDFLALGGHSLLAARLVAWARQRFAADLPLEAVFERRTVAGLAEALAGAPAGTGPPGPAPGGPDGPAPLSFPQEAVWFLQHLRPGLRAYNFQATLRLRGALDVAALEAALNEVVRRHEILRTSFPATGGVPAQLVHPFRPFALRVVDAGAAGAAGREEAARRLLREELSTVFDPGRLPLVRWTLVRLAPDEHVLVHVEHHLAHDGWSFNVLLREVVALYLAAIEGRPSPLPAPPLQFRDFARWQREWIAGPEAARQRAYWIGRLSGAPAPPLAAGGPRPAVQRFLGDAPRVDLPVALCDALRELGRREQATLFMTLLAAFAVLLARYAGQEDVSVGSGFAARRRPELEGLIGMVVNTVVLRVDVGGEPTFRELLGRVRRVTLEALEHQEYPFDRLVQELRPHRDLAAGPLFQAMFSFHDHQLPDLDLPGLRVELTEAIANGTAKFDLNVVAIPRWERRLGAGAGAGERGVTLIWEYDGDLFEPAAVERMVGRYRALLEAAAAAPDRPLAELAPAAAAPAAPARHPTWCLHERFAAEAGRRPGAVALTCEGEPTTYGELDARANRLANRLRRLGVGPEVVVGVCAERSPALLVATLGVLKAGGAYLPLDPAHPPARLRAALREARAALLLTAGVPGAAVPSGAAPVLDLDAAWPSIEAESEAAPAAGVVPDNAAYVIFTSGSTGRPKGVVVTHAAVSRLLEAARPLVGPGDNDVWTLFHSFAFDFSVWETWGALAFGGRLVVVPHWVSRSPEAFRRLLLDEGVTVLSQTPSAFAELARVDELLGEPGDWRLRLVVFGGEALDFAALEPWLRAHGDGRPRLLNMYGITETTVHVTALPVTAALLRERRRLIGEPLSDLRAHVLDGGLRPRAEGMPGELYVAGDGLARGYVGRPGLTAERFLPDPFAARPGARLYRTGDVARRLPDGGLEYLGRADRQLKVRGFRVEPEEVEAALAAHPRVRRAAAFARPGADGRPELAACVVPEGEPPPARELRRFLAERLPDFMVPAALVAVERLPLTPNGKLDRGALPDLAAGRPEPDAAFVPAGSPTEVALAGIWAELLGREQVGARDDWFELGGHSLAAMRLVARVRERLGVEVPVRAVFEAPTVAELAARVDRELGRR